VSTTRGGDAVEPKSRTEWVVLGATSIIALILLVLQLVHNNWSVDLWVVVVLGVGALPWFWRVLESVDFPGGGGLKLRKLEKEQIRQGEEIKTLQFLVAHFLPDEQQGVLRKFAESKPIEGGPNMPSGVLEAIGRLQMGGFIEPQPERFKPENSAVFTSGGTINDWYKVTDRGREYLDILDKNQTSEK
jgi:hypothetical protein